MSVDRPDDPPPMMIDDDIIAFPAKPKWGRNRRAMAADLAALERLAALHRSDIDRLTRERDAWAARCADAEDTVRGLRDRLARADSVTVTTLRREVALLRETVAALDARNDGLRREVAHWERGHAACERARQLIERAQPTGSGKTS